jgi:heme-degrading monooxygenase HmoA
LLFPFLCDVIATVLFSVFVTNGVYERRKEEKMAVKIIIKRRVPKNKEAQLLPLLLELRSKATTQPGYISGETLRNMDDPEDFVVISTWQSAENWKAWDASKGKAEIQEKIDGLLGERTTYGLYYYG